MLNFRKLAASSQGEHLRKYFTENTPEPSHDPMREPGKVYDPGGRTSLLSSPKQPALIPITCRPTRLLTICSRPNVPTMVKLGPIRNDPYPGSILPSPPISR